jgi:hypothetical protein
MQRGASTLWFLLVIAVGVGFIWMTSRELPPLVASHFGSSGIANGFIPHKSYLLAVIFACTVLPMVIVFPISIAMNSPNAVINLPNRDYWLAPERRAETVSFVRKQMMRFGTAMLIFICYVHWLVVRANEQSPPRLAAGPFVSAVAVFVGFIIVWIAIHFTRFRRSAA